MGPEENILVNSPIFTFQHGLTHSALTKKGFKRVMFLGSYIHSY